MYDNAEMLNLALFMKDKNLIIELQDNIKSTFILKDNIYSYVDFFNIKRNKNTLRWAVMPYIYSISKFKI